MSEAQKTRKDRRDNRESHLHVSPGETASHEPEDLTTEEVRQGHTGDHVRYILAFSLALAFGAMILIVWLAVL